MTTRQFIREDLIFHHLQMLLKNLFRFCFIHKRFIFVCISLGLVAVSIGAAAYWYCRVVYVIDVSPGKNTQTLTLRNLEDLRGISLLQASVNDISDIVKRNNPLIDQILVTKKYPQTLEIMVSWRTGVVQTQAGTSRYVLDKDAYIVATLSEEPSQQFDSLPSLTFYQEIPDGLPVGEQLKISDLQNALDATFVVKKYTGSIKSIDISSLGVILLQAEGYEILFSRSKAIESQLYLFETIFPRLAPRDIQVSKIDLRFDKPIITY